MIMLRPAIDQDMEWVRAVQNDPEVQRVCRRRHDFTRVEHQRWWQKNSMNVFIGDIGRARIGFGHFYWTDPGRVVISLALDKQHRCQGNGQKLLQLLILKAREKGAEMIQARVKTFNWRSVRMFQAAKFVPLLDEVWWSLS